VQDCAGHTWGRSNPSVDTGQAHVSRCLAAVDGDVPPVGCSLTAGLVGRFTGLCAPAGVFGSRLNFSLYLIEYLDMYRVLNIDYLRN
jgi:hypothetical protein